MSRTFTIALPDDLEQRVIARAARLNQSPETDPLLALIGSLSSETTDLASTTATSVKRSNETSTVSNSLLVDL